MKPATLLAGAAALAMLAAATPAAAQSSVGFSVSVGNGYRSGYGYDRHYRPSRYYGYGSPGRYRAADPCALDPYYCYGPYGGFPAPSVTYETREVYDPMPRWREIAGDRGQYGDYGRYEGDPYYRDQGARYDDQPAYRGYDDRYGQDYDVDLYGHYQPEGGATYLPETRGDLVRYDLMVDDRQARQGTADIYSNPVYVDPYPAPPSGGYADPNRAYDAPVRYDQYDPNGAAQSYIRGGGDPAYGDPEDLLLGGR